MTDPEIARRCSVCGATIRKRAMFCPQCGQNVPDESAASGTGAKSSRSKPKNAKTKRETRDTQIELKDPTSFKAAETVPLKPVSPIVESATAETLPVVEAPGVEISKYTETAPTQALNAYQAAAVYTGPARRSANTRSANTQTLGTLGKLKKVSSVVIDQAAYDPSMRFLLIAGFLFVVFLLLLLFSKFIG